LHGLFGGCGKIPEPKSVLLEPISQTLFPLQSRLAPKSVSVYGSPILLVMGAPPFSTLLATVQGGRAEGIGGA